MGEKFSLEILLNKDLNKYSEVFQIVDWDSYSLFGLVFEYSKKNCVFFWYLGNKMEILDNSKCGSYIDINDPKLKTFEQIRDFETIKKCISFNALKSKCEQQNHKIKKITINEVEGLEINNWILSFNDCKDDFFKGLDNSKYKFSFLEFNDPKNEIIPFFDKLNNYAYAFINEYLRKKNSIVLECNKTKSLEQFNHFINTLELQSTDNKLYTSTNSELEKFEHLNKDTKMLNQSKYDDLGVITKNNIFISDLAISVNSIKNTRIKKNPSLKDYFQIISFNENQYVINKDKNFENHVKTYVKNYVKSADITSYLKLFPTHYIGKIESPLRWIYPISNLSINKFKQTYLLRDNVYYRPEDLCTRLDISNTSLVYFYKVIDFNNYIILISKQDLKPYIIDTEIESKIQRINVTILNFDNNKFNVKKNIQFNSNVHNQHTFKSIKNENYVIMYNDSCILILNYEDIRKHKVIPQDTENPIKEMVFSNNILFVLKNKILYHCTDIYKINKEDHLLPCTIPLSDSEKDNIINIFDFSKPNGSTQICLVFPHLSKIFKITFKESDIDIEFEFLYIIKDRYTYYNHNFVIKNKNVYMFIKNKNKARPKQLKIKCHGYYKTKVWTDSYVWNLNRHIQEFEDIDNFTFRQIDQKIHKNMHQNVILTLSDKSFIVYNPVL